MVKSRMLPLVREFRWREVKAALDESPDLIGFRDNMGRNWLHLCCSVNEGSRGGDASAASIRTAEVLLDSAIDVNDPAAIEGEWKATPLWYAIAWGENLALSRYLLERGSDPNHCLWAAVNRNSPAAIRLLIEHGAADPRMKKRRR